MLITGRQEAQEAGETRPYISLYLSKIWVDVVVLPTPDLREEQSVDNTVFANQFSFFLISVNQVSWRVANLCPPYSEGSSFKSRLKGMLSCLTFFLVSLQAYAAIVPQIKPRPLPYVSFRFHCWPVLPFDAVVTWEKVSQKEVHFQLTECVWIPLLGTGSTHITKQHYCVVR